MESREQGRAQDDALDARIDQLHTGQPEAPGRLPAEERVAHEFARLSAEESPRLSTAARNRGLAALRERAALKRQAVRPGPLIFLRRVPRWAQMAVVALIVVLLANGVTSAAADSLPGSFWYPFKRITEGGQLFFQNSNAQRARVWMSLANTRLDEAQRLLRSGKQVDPSMLDAVDESILRALSELAGTRGDERVELLKTLTQLAIRQQQVLRQMATNAPPEQRARLEQSANFLQGVANYASSDAAIGPELDPLRFLTPPATASPAASPTPASTATMKPSRTPTPEPSEMPSASPVPTGGDAKQVAPTATVEPRAAGDDATKTPRDDGTASPGKGGEPKETPKPSETDGAEPTDKPEETGAPKPTKTVEPADTLEPTQAPQPTETTEPTETKEPTKTKEPTQVPGPTETDEPHKTHEPTETKEPTKTKAPAKTQEPTKTPHT